MQHTQHTNTTQLLAPPSQHRYFHTQDKCTSSDPAVVPSQLPPAYPYIIQVRLTQLSSPPLRTS